MNFIKKIFDKKIDESVHLQFQKFSRGDFTNRAIISAKNSSGKYTINTTSEFAHDFVNILAKKLGGNKTKITGSIISTGDLKGELEFKSIKQFQGVKNYSIEGEMSGNEIIDLMKKFPKNFFALSFSVNDDLVKIKPKAPKSGKPSSKGEEAPKADFCKFITKNKEIVQSFIFEKPDFKTASVIHTFAIDSIVIPNELKNEKDFAIVREKSLRKGKIIRKAIIDDKEIVSEIEFEA
ncbi:hypothetical protein M0R19_06955 [Candidatus Pacearchaeota archaeon]|jgi:hypothetical protein|nr:hypothetical protein [Candidatus Pacearchaeota archaeon]